MRKYREKGESIGEKGESIGKSERLLEKRASTVSEGVGACQGRRAGPGGRRAGDGPAAAPEGAAAAAATPGCPRPSMAMQGMELCAVAVVILLFIAVLKQFGILEPISAEGNPRPPPRAGVGRGSVLGCPRWGRDPGGCSSWRGCWWCGCLSQNICGGPQRFWGALHCPVLDPLSMLRPWSPLEHPKMGCWGALSTHRPPKPSQMGCWGALSPY